MGINEEIKIANQNIISDINDLSKDIVIREYQPLLIKLKILPCLIWGNLELMK